MANSSILFAGTENGLAIINKPGTLPEWLPPRMVLSGQRVSAVWAEAGPPIKVMADSGGALSVSENGGRTWVDVGITARSAEPAAASYLAFVEDEQVIYAALPDGTLLMALGGGLGWEEMPPLPGSGSTLWLERTQRNGQAQGDFYLLRTGEPGTLYVGTPGEGNWAAAAGRGLPSAGITQLAQASDSGHIYATTAEGIFTSSDRGATWELLAGSPQGGTAIVAIPGAGAQPPALVASTSGGLAVSGDGGATWQTPGLPAGRGVTALVRDPERRDRLYAATEGGLLYESGNRGQAWQPVNREPLSRVISMYVIRI